MKPVLWLCAWALLALPAMALATVDANTIAVACALGVVGVLALATMLDTMTHPGDNGNVFRLFVTLVCALFFSAGMQVIGASYLLLVFVLPCAFFVRFATLEEPHEQAS